MRLLYTLVMYHLLAQIVRFLSHFTGQKELLQRLNLTKEKTGISRVKPIIRFSISC